MYLELRAKVEKFEEETNPLVRTADEQLTGEGARWSQQRRCLTGLVMLIIPLSLVAGVLFVGLIRNNIRNNSAWLGISLVIWAPVSASIFFFLPSRILRAHLAAVLCCRPRDSREYTFHWSVRKPPLRPRPRPASGLRWQDVHEQPSAGVELTSTELAAALETKTEFTPEEWAAFGIADLQFDHFIKVGGTYYQPFEIPEGFRPSVRSQTGARVLGRTPVIQG
eukprot:scaffold119983_cov57-Phaeocystis_antarctica.AAC.2